MPIKTPETSIHIFPKALLYCGVLIAPIFILCILYEGATRAEYSSLKFAISSLSLGNQGWMQMTNYIVTGALMCLFALGLKAILSRRQGKSLLSNLVGIAGIGLIGAGIFVTDPIFGYPLNEPFSIAQHTWQGHLHDAFSILFFIGVPWASFEFRKYFVQHGNHNWANYSIIIGLIMIGTFVIANMGFKQNPNFVNYAGVFQRLSVFSGLIWLSSLALYFLKDGIPVIKEEVEVKNQRLD